MTLNRLSTGVSGLNEILHGGLIPSRAYLVRGGPGTGKTTLGLHFLVAGASKGEAAVFISLEESEENVQKNAHALGLDLGGVTFLDLSPGSDFFAEGQTYDIFSPAEVEREPTTRKIIEQVEALQPRRVFLEVMSEFRYLSSDPFQFRKQVLSFLRFLTAKGATVLLSSEGSILAPDDDLQFMADGVIHLDSAAPGRTVRVTKFRGSEFRAGRHSMRLTSRGMEVFPRLLPSNHGREFEVEQAVSGIGELDALLHGGLERGMITIITGPTGVGKTTVGLQFMMQAARRGERAVVYTFEESRETMLARSAGVGMPLQPLIDSQMLSVVQVEPLRFTPDEFAHLVRQEVEDRSARLVMLDSVSGYHLSMHGEEMDGNDDRLVIHLHALCKYLRNMGVTGILVNEVERFTGEFRATESGISYLTDNIIFLRYVEMNAEIHRVIGVLKKRLSGFERALRELEIIPHEGIKVGPPLTGLTRILTGTPEWSDKHQKEVSAGT
ncbi:MAG: putative circadian clock protein KaiC [Chthoniobacteraceae bacterium]|nr:putative circadian clock protein KaiC [Chthoniobacteraceae bacterium]